MTDPLLLREATESDAPAIAQISVTGWQQAYAHLMPESFLTAIDVDARTRGWLEVLQSTTARVIVAEAADTVVGFVSFGPTRDDDATGSRTAEIYAIYVSPDRWREGIGRELLLASLDDCAERFEDITLWVLTGNAAARSFYSAQGFDPDGAAKVESRNGTVLDEVRYRRSLRECTPTSGR